MTATKTRTRSAFQIPADGKGGSLLIILGSSHLPEEKSDYLHSAYIEFINAEETIAVVSRYNSYDIVVKTQHAVTDVVTEDSDYLTRGGYSPAVARGIWFALPRLGDKSKTRTRAAADALLARVQNVSNPLQVSIDGSFAPALTIARSKWENESEYYQDQRRVSALTAIADEAGVHPLLLALAVKEDRLIWSTPPAAPKQVLVVVQDSETGLLVERLVDEIVLASGEVDGSRILAEGSVSEFHVARRVKNQFRSIADIVEARARLSEALKGVAARAASLQESLDKGNSLTGGLRDRLNLGDGVEEANAAAAAYRSALLNADLPESFQARLSSGEFQDSSDYTSGAVRNALEAFCVLTGTSLKEIRFW